ncbi:LptA/OstA family protein [Thermodesulfobacteriota bacterium]
MMSNKHFRILSYWISTVILLVAADLSYAADSIFKGYNPGDTVSISSKGLWKFDLDKNIITINEDIVATDDDIILKCQKMVIHYLLEANDEKEKQTEPRILKIIASDSVVITSPEFGTTSSEMAIYDLLNNQITLTGNPKLKREGSTAESCEIVFYLTDDLIEMYSCDNKKNKATFSHEDIETSTK